MRRPSNRRSFELLEEVRAAVLQGADSITGLEDLTATGGRLNAHAALVVDTFAPRPTLSDAPDALDDGATSYPFDVTYTDNNSVQFSSLDVNDDLVTKRAKRRRANARCGRR